jgi:hypothetical protein
VFTAKQGNAAPEVRAAMEGLFAQIATIPDLSVISPYSA